SAFFLSCFLSASRVVHSPHIAYPSHSHVRAHFSFFFFNDPAPTAIYTLSLHDALPISGCNIENAAFPVTCCAERVAIFNAIAQGDRKSTRLNSSHVSISYAVFCLKKKKINIERTRRLHHESHKHSHT